MPALLEADLQTHKAAPGEAPPSKADAVLALQWPVHDPETGAPESTPGPDATLFTRARLEDGVAALPTDSKEVSTRCMVGRGVRLSRDDAFVRDSGDRSRDRRLTGTAFTCDTFPTEGTDVSAVAPGASTANQASTSRHDADSVIVARVQQGDTEAFEHLVLRYGRRIHLTLAGILRRDQDLEDAVQDTFVSAFRHIRSFEGRSSFLTWLTRIAINTGLRLLRRRDTVSLDDSHDAVDEAPPLQIAASDDNPEQQYARNAMRSLVWRAVMELPSKYRVVVMLRDLQQMTTAETAATLDLGTQAVKARLFRGRLMVREALAPYVADGRTMAGRDRR